MIQPGYSLHAKIVVVYMRILSLCLSVSTPGHSWRTRPHMLAEEWVKMGHEVRFIGAASGHLIRDPLPFDADATQVEECGVRYSLIHPPSYSGNSIGRARAMLTAAKLARREALRICRDWKPDVAIAGTVDQLDNFAVHEVGKATGAFLIRETRDLWPMTLKEMTKTWAINPLYYQIQRAEDLGCRRFDAVISTLSDAYRYLATRGLTRDRFFYSPQIVPNADLLASAQCPPQLLDFVTDAKLVCVFIGSIVPSQMVGMMLDAVTGLAEEGVKMVVLGEGHERESLRARVKQRAQSNVLFLDSVPRGEVPAVLSACQVGLKAYDNVSLFEYGVSPNKLMDYAASGLPSIMSAGTRGTFLESENCGLVTPAGDVLAFREAIRTMLALSPEERQQMGERGRQYVLKHCVPTKIAADYLSLVASVPRRNT